MIINSLNRRLLSLIFILLFTLACNLLQTSTDDSTNGQIPATEIPTLVPAVDDETLIRAAIAIHTGILETELEISIDINTGTHVTGNYNQVGTASENYYLAAKVNDGWVIAYVGQSIPLCDEVDHFNFPAEVLPECLDQYAEGFPTLEAALLARTGIPEAELEYTISVNTGTHVKGMIIPKADEELAYFLAVTVPAGWLVVHDGQATPNCVQIDPYDFPMDFVPECIDAEGAIFDRAAEDYPGIQAALATRTGIAVEELDFTIGVNTGNHAWGNVRKAGTVSGGYYLAAKVDDGWIVAYDGQAMPSCTEVDPFLFPTSMVPSCLDEAMNIVDRSTYDYFGIRTALAERTEIAEEDLDFTIDANTGVHAKGSVQHKDSLSGAHYLATKIDDLWVVVFDGQDAPSCQEILPYNFPDELVPFCQ